VTDDAKPVLNQLNLVVGDMDATIAFYRRLGLDIPDEAAQDGIRHVEIEMADGIHLDLDNETLARVYNAEWRRPEGGSRALLGFGVSSRAAVDDKYAELIGAGFRGVQPPYDAFWGARYAIVADPDGNEVGLMSPQDDDMRSFPPSNSPEAS
jgi:catechol 2,3-dioxygenase-like lactoylglutathione lyase family enzyme